MLVLIGFTQDEMEKIGREYEIVPVYRDMRQLTLQEVIDSEKRRMGDPLSGQKFVIMHNIPKSEIGATMRRIRELVPEHIIFATSTPTSLTWKIEALMEELLEEDRYFRSRTK